MHSRLLLTQFGSGLESDNPFNENSQVGTNSLSNLERLLSTAIGALTVIAGLIFIIYFLLGALSWVTAGGDSGKVQKARDQMVQGVIGLIVVIAAYGIIGVIGAIVGLDLLNPAAALNALRPI